MKIENREFLPKRSLSCHAASICFHPNGHPVFSWFEGTREGNSDVVIRLYNLNNDQKSILIGNRDVVPRWNPILFTFGQKIYLFEKMGEFCDRWQTLLHDITDWSNEITAKQIVDGAQIIPAGLNGPVKTKPLQYGNFIYCGSSVETFMDWASYIECYLYMDGKFSPYFRTNPLKTGKKHYQSPYNGATSLSLGIIQPSLWLDKDGNMNAFFRASYGLGRIFHSKTNRFGIAMDNEHKHWSEPRPIDIDNPNSSIDTVYINDRLFLICNPVKIGRNPLVLFELDSQFSPIDSLVITDEIRETTISGECSYPYMVEKDGKIHIVYTYGRSKIEYIVVAI